VDDRKLQLYDVQQSALFVSESLTLADLAKVAANAQATAAIPLLTSRAATMAALIVRRLQAVSGASPTPDIDLVLVIR
jgi:hypothetical protein